MPDLPGAGRVTKRFRVAREGQTVDGRTLSRQEIVDMANTYNPVTYGGRINVEHISGFSPQPPFNAYGDIVAVDCDLEAGQMCLYNTISALPNFIEMNKQGQKIYPSIEFIRDFAGTGKAYQVGLGMTDNPASLGTEAIKFSQQGFPVLRTAPSSEIFYMTTPAQQNEQQNSDQGLLNQLKNLLTGQKPAATPSAAQTPELLTATAESVVKLAESIEKLSSTQTIIMQGLSTLLTAAKPAAESAETPTATSTALETNLLTQIQKVTTPAAPAPASASPVSDADRLSSVEKHLGTLVELLSKQPSNSAAPVVTGGSAGGVNLF